MTTPTNLETHVLNRSETRFAVRPAQDDIDAWMRFFRAIASKKMPANLPVPTLAHHDLRMVMDAFPDSAYYSIRHIQGGSVCAIGVVGWGAGLESLKAAHWIINRYVHAITLDEASIKIPEANAPLLPETIPFAAVAYLAPYYVLSSRDPEAPGLFTRVLDMAAFCSIELAVAARPRPPETEAP